MKSIEWTGGKVRFIDQTKLPTDEIFIETDDVAILADAIRTLKVRGAPAFSANEEFVLAQGLRAFSVLNMAML